jgi:hypothetical protein
MTPDQEWEYVLDDDGNYATDDDGDVVITNGSDYAVLGEDGDIYEPRNTRAAAEAIIGIAEDYPDALDLIQESAADQMAADQPEPQTFSEAIDRGLDDALAEAKGEADDPLPPEVLPD